MRGVIDICEQVFSATPRAWTVARPGVAAARPDTAVLRRRSRHRPRPAARAARPGTAVPGPLVFGVVRAAEVLATFARFGRYYWKLRRLGDRIHRDPERKQYRDEALAV